MMLMTGFYSNLLRAVHDGDDGRKQVNYLIEAVAAQRFHREGHGVLNLGLNPLGLVCRELRASAKGRRSVSGISHMETLLSWVAQNSVLNATTYPYENVMRTKQQNWKQREDIPSYVVLEGNAAKQGYQALLGFIMTGAVGAHVVANIACYGTHRLRSLIKRKHHECNAASSEIKVPDYLQGRGWQKRNRIFSFIDPWWRWMFPR